MKTELAPVTFGIANIDVSTLSVSAILFTVIVALLLGARQEMAMFAVFAGIVGVILAV